MAIAEVVKTSNNMPFVKDFIGLSTDTKSEVNVPVGSTFYETDTTKGFIWDGSAWVEV